MGEMVAEEHVCRIQSEEVAAGTADRYASATAAASDDSAARSFGALVRVHMGSGDVERGRDVAERRLAEARRSGGPWSRYQAAKVAADMALNSGDVARARQLIAGLCEDARALDAAGEGSLFATEVAPRSRRLASCAGRVYWDSGRHHAGVAYFTALLTAEPGLSWALAGRGVTYRLMGRHKDAVTDLSAAIVADADYALALANRGEVRRLQRRYADALADLEHAIRLLPGYAWALGSRGQVYQALGRTAEALADFKRALELDPGLGWVRAAKDAVTGRKSAG
ncbi:MAG: tetratricopeptide repeat protein [Streptosporangiaceae bacterium]